MPKMMFIMFSWFFARVWNETATGGARVAEAKESEGAVRELEPGKVPGRGAAGTVVGENTTAGAKACRGEERRKKKQEQRKAATSKK